MKLVRHLVRYELQSLLPLIGAWAAVLLLQASVLSMGPPVPLAERGPELEIRIDVVALVMRFAMTVVIMVVLVHRHYLVGTAAFWRTRPIPRGAVLASTLLSGILLTVVVPFVWFTGSFLWMGLDPAAALCGALPIAGEQALLASFALVLASVTANLAQVVVFGIGAMVFIFLGTELVKDIPRHPGPFTIPRTEVAGLWTLIAGWAVLGTVAALIAGHQYVTLKTTRSKILIAAVLAGLVMLRPFSLWTWATDAPVADTGPAVPTPGLGLDLASVRSEHYATTGDEGTEIGVRQIARLNQESTGEPIILMPVKVVSTLTFPDGTSIGVSPRHPDAWTENTGEPAFADDPYARIAEAVGDATLAEQIGSTAGRYRFLLLDVSPGVFAARAGQPALLNVTMTLEAYRHAIVARLPLVEGSKARSARYMVEFLGTVAVGAGLAVDIREAALKERRPIAPEFYVLRNPRLNQAALATTRWTRWYGSSVFDSSTVHVGTTRLTFKSRPGVSLDGSWLADAELLVLKPEALGRVTKAIRVNDYRLAPPAADR